jgi:DnaK suppressor protein
MTQKELAQYRKILSAKLSVLTREIKNRDDIVIEPLADALDITQQKSAQDLAILNKNRQTAEINQILAALDRIDEGIFGSCEDCEAEINAKRLQAIPYAKRCCNCQSVLDNQTANGFSSILELEQA